MCEPFARLVRNVRSQTLSNSFDSCGPNVASSLRDAWRTFSHTSAKLWTVKFTLQSLDWKVYFATFCLLLFWLQSLQADLHVSCIRPTCITKCNTMTGWLRWSQVRSPLTLCGRSVCISRHSLDRISAPETINPVCVLFTFSPEAPCNSNGSPLGKLFKLFKLN